MRERERQRGMKIRDERYEQRRWRISKKRTTMRNKDNKRGNVATLLIENSSALAILIKSRKSLARSIGQTRKVRSVRFALWQWSFAARTLYAISAFRSPVLFLLFEIFESIIAEETQIYHILYEWVSGNIYFLHYKFEAVCWLKIKFKLYLIYYNFRNNCNFFKFLIRNFFFRTHVFSHRVSDSFLFLFILWLFNVIASRGNCVSH